MVSKQPAQNFVPMNFVFQACSKLGETIFPAASEGKFLGNKKTTNKPPKQDPLGKSDDLDGFHSNPKTRINPPNYRVLKGGVSKGRG